MELLKKAAIFTGKYVAAPVAAGIVGWWAGRKHLAAGVENGKYDIIGGKIVKRDAKPAQAKAA